MDTLKKLIVRTFGKRPDDVYEEDTPRKFMSVEKTVGNIIIEITNVAELLVSVSTIDEDGDADEYIYSWSEEEPMSLGTEELTLILKEMGCKYPEEGLDNFANTLYLMEQCGVSKIEVFKDADNNPVYLNTDTLRHMAAHSDVDFDHIEEGVSQISMSDSTFYMDTLDFERPIGTTKCVYTSKKQRKAVSLVTRPYRDGKTPVIISEGEDTDLLTLGLCKQDGVTYLFTAFYGLKAPREPWDKNISSEQELAEAEAFWNCHALAVTEEELKEWED